MWLLKHKNPEHEQILDKSKSGHLLMINDKTGSDIVLSALAQKQMSAMLLYHCSSRVMHWL